LRRNLKIAAGYEPGQITGNLHAVFLLLRPAPLVAKGLTFLLLEAAES